MSILEELYKGELHPVEKVIPQNADYRLIAKEIGDEREYFAGKMSAEDKERFKKWNERIFNYEEMVEFANFSYGFKLGAKLTHEIYEES